MIRQVNKTGVNLQKAFDTWFRSYLADRTQSVHVNAAKSDFKSGVYWAMFSYHLKLHTSPICQLPIVLNASSFDDWCNTSFDWTRKEKQRMDGTEGRSQNFLGTALHGA
ncbi:hypothetical protein DPMN_086786 [Dreissena polymorpha]|uniref:Uncharacterized protein n=1 Tax=Dreissena polymorpha TaxID=45954 RepID=A0A9D4KSI0_DREPO|nr:hypothetical protein DPMN_086786 [Dreissena polymorpha]